MIKITVHAKPENIVLGSRAVVMAMPDLASTRLVGVKVDGVFFSVYRAESGTIIAKENA